MIATPGVARATVCGDWNAGLTVTPLTDHESKALTITWNAAPAACYNAIPYGPGWPGVHHYEVVRNGDPGDPLDLATIGTYTSNGQVLSVSGVTTGNDFVHRPDAWMGYRIYACQTPSCSSWYGDDTGTTGFLETASDYYNSGTTQPERWLLQGITGEDDVDMGVVVDSEDQSANAPDPFFFPSDYGVDLSSHLALYYSTQPVGETFEVWRLMWPDTGWESGGFNVEGGWSDELLVGEGSTDTADSDYHADHPFTMLTENGTYHNVVLFVQSQLGEGEHDQITQIRSVGATGEDFGMECGDAYSLPEDECTDYYSTASASHSVAIAADGEEATNWVFSARHGRLLRHTIDDPYVTAGTDHPVMLFQLQRPPTGDCGLPGNDDIGMATGTWNGTQWEWEVELDEEDCPAVQIANGHDAAVVPLPYGAFKVYWKKYPWTSGDDTTDLEDDQWYASIWDGAEWATWYNSAEEEVSATPIDFFWDDTTFAYGPDSKCVDNIGALVRAESGSFYDGMFFKLADSDICGATGFSDGAGGSDNAIVFALLAE